MKVKSVNNPDKEVTWNLSKTRWPMKSKAACRSKRQYEIGQLIKGQYPFSVILEDVTIPDTRLSLDFLLPDRKLAFEIQGEQHHERNPFFHKTNTDFIEQQDRDNLKELFCELNHITLITFDSIKEAQEYFEE